MDFQNAEIAFASKTTFELLRTWLIFRVCALGPVVRHCDSLYALGLKVVGGTVTHGVLRHTFFNHFCAGETVPDITPRMAELRKHGVGGILDYAAEAKDDAPLPAVDESTTVGATSGSAVFQYQSEALCDANAEIFYDAIKAVHDATPDGFAAIKLSGLGDPMLLERMSTCLLEMTRLYKRICDGGTEADPTVPFYMMDRSFLLDFDTFHAGWRAMFTGKDDAEIRELFDRLDKDKSGAVSYLEYTECLRLSEINELVKSCKEHGPLSRAALTADEMVLYRNLINRVLKILDYAAKLGVRVMIDAEWTDIQPAIDHVVLHLQRIYNRGDQPVVFNTYQTYLKGMPCRVRRDLDRSATEGWRFGAKVVRGAYMVSEREKAAKRGVQSPICETYEDTEANFHQAIDAIMSHERDRPDRRGTPAEILIASHSRSSVEHALRQMHEHGKDPATVYFGQLLGMSDHLTFTLARAGYKAYKYVPYGPIDEVVPYLIRRTQENSAVLGSPSVQEERRMVVQEVKRRLLPFGSHPVHA